MNKREFLKISSLAVAGSVVAAPTKAELLTSGLSAGQPIIRILGKTGIKLPVVSSGSLMIDNLNLIREVFKSGMLHFDSAHIYQNGKNDVMLGEMFKEFGRDRFTVSTKISFQTDKETGQYKSDTTSEAFLEKLNESLRNQKTDYVDILYLHAPPTRAAAMNEQILNGLRIAKEQGKTKYIGIATHSNQVELLETAVESKFYDVVLVGYNFRGEDIIKSAIANAAGAGMGIIAMKTLAGKFLDKEKTQPISKSAALKWVLQDENVHTAIMSIRSIDDLELYKSIMYDIKMSPEELQDIDSYKHSAGLYCHGCEQCRIQCPYKLPVPDIMRAYMYAYGYGETLKAKEVIMSSGFDKNICNLCPVCTVNCKNGLNVSERINDIYRLKDVPVEFLA